jgi:septal ring factor EnvC (AmiA/AmiB activator)
MEMVRSTHLPFMETAMTDKPRDTSGKFAPKSETPRRIRSVNLTDDAWQWLVATAQKAGMSRNDYLEALAEGDNPFIETAAPQTQPLMETAAPQTQPLIETVNTEIETDANPTPQPDSKLSPLMETVCAENQRLQIELGNSEAKREELNQELASVRSQLEAVQAENKELKASQPEIEFEPLEASELLNRLKAKRKKATASLADIEALLEMMGK